MTPRAKSPRVPVTFEVARAPFQFYAWVLARNHIQLIRWQFLAVIDTRWEFCPAILVVPAGRTAFTHLAALVKLTKLQVARPRAWRFRSFHRDRTIRTSAAKRFFERLEKAAAFIPGHIAPHRARALQQLARACESGCAKPRRHFLPLATVLARAISCVQFANTEPVTSSAGWGCWIPWEKFDQQLKEKSLAHLPNHNRKN